MRIFSILIIVFVLGFGSQYGALAGAPDAYVPGLGEFMAAIQLRHAKLWFAGKAKNWQLAAYELDELREVFEDAAKYQPEFKGKPIAELIGQVTNEPMASLKKRSGPRMRPDLPRRSTNYRLLARPAINRRDTGSSLFNAPFPRL